MYAANLILYVSDPGIDFKANSNYSLSYSVYFSNANVKPSNLTSSLVHWGGGRFQYSAGTNYLLGPTGTSYVSNYTQDDRFLALSYYFMGNVPTLGPYYLWVKASGGPSFSSNIEKTLSASFTFPSGWNMGRTNTSFLLTKMQY